jgi:hypothetical protein
MKRSLLVSSGLLIIMILLGLRNQNRLDAALRYHKQILIEASRAGVSVSLPSTKRSIRSRENPEVQRALAECRAVITAGGKDDALIQSIASGLSALNLQELIIAVHGDQLLTKEHRIKVFNELMFYVSQNKPKQFIEMVLKHPEFVSGEAGDKELRRYACIAIQTVAGYDPEAAVNASLQLRKLMPAAIKVPSRILLEAFAKLPPQRVFDWYREMGIQPEPFDLNLYFTAAKTPAKKAEKAWALSDYIRSFENSPLRNELMAGARRDLAAATGRAGFDSGKAWADAVVSTADEASSFLWQAINTSANGDIPHWIEWAAAKFPDKVEKLGIDEGVRHWADSDYQAAGNWLTSLPDGPLKIQAIQGYVDGVKTLDPEVARQWALTLPPGPEREEMLKRIKVK